MTLQEGRNIADYLFSGNPVWEKMSIVYFSHFSELGELIVLTC